MNGQREMFLKSLHQAAREGDSDAIRQHLKNYKAPSLISGSSGRSRDVFNQLDEASYSPLHYAARYARVECIELLVSESAGGKPLLPGEEGTTPLHLAAKHGDKACMEAIFKGISASQHQSACAVSDEYGQTPAHFACFSDNDATLSFILDKNKDALNDRDTAQMTPLHLAMHTGNSKVIACLLENGADVFAVDVDGRNPLHRACHEGQVEAVQILSSFLETTLKDTMKKLIASEDNEKHTPLAVSMYSGNVELVSLLFDLGAKPDTKTATTRRTPLHTAARTGDLDIVKLLVSKGAKKHVKDYQKMMPVHRAAHYGRVEILSYLLEDDSDRRIALEAVTKFGETPLMMASWQGHAAAVQLLLQLGANPLRQDKVGKTSLHMAVEEGHVECVKVLLERAQTMSVVPAIPHAKIDEEDEGDEDELLHDLDDLSLADSTASGDFKSSNPMLEADDKYNMTPLHLACRWGQAEVAKLLIDAGADIEASDDSDMNPLHYAVRAGSLEICEDLIEKHAGVNEEDDKGQTPLHHAAQIGDHRIIQLLLDNGADIESQDDAHQTPLCESAKAGHGRAVRVLLEHDAVVNHADKSGATPLHMAARGNHDIVAKILLEYTADPSIQDKKGLTALDSAATHGSHEVAKLILQCPSWRHVLTRKVSSNHTLNRDSKQLGMTPLKRLILLMPDMASYSLSKCITTDLTPDHDDYTVYYDFSLIDDDSQTGESVISLATKLKRGELLLHPLINRWLVHQWKTLAQPLFLSHIITYLLFLAFLTGFLLDNQVEESLATGYTLSLFSIVARWWILVFVGLSALTEMFQLYQGGWAYFNYQNFMDWAVYGTSVALLVPFGDMRLHHWYSGSIAVFLAWMNLLIFVQRTPVFGTYILMFTDTFATVIKVLTVFSLFIVAFALSFYIMLQDQASFRTPGKSIVKTLVMMTGEYEYDNIFTAGCDTIVNSTICGDSDPCLDPSCPFEFSIPLYIFFIFFVILMNIILMNLLIGLAVGDIEKVSRSASINRQYNKANYILSSHRWVPRRFRSTVKEMEDKPNANKNKNNQQNVAFALFDLLTEEEEGQQSGVQQEESEEEKFKAIRRGLRDVRHQAHEAGEALDRLQAQAESNIAKLRNMKTGPRNLRRKQSRRQKTMSQMM